MEYGGQPFGLNQIKIRTDAGFVFLEAAQVLAFVPRLRASELRGVKIVKDVVTRVEALDWGLEEGGLPLAALNAMTGWTLTETGSTPGRANTLKAHAGTEFPYFTIYGEALGMVGDSVQVVIYKAKITGRIEGFFEHGKFQVLQLTGVAVDDGTGLFDLIQNETAPIQDQATDRLLLDGGGSDFLLLESGDYLLIR